MSNTAFGDKWSRMSAARRMLVILTYLAKTQDITIPFADLEEVEAGEGMIEIFKEGNLQILFAPTNTRISFLGEDKAMERPAWQPNATDPMERLAKQMGLEPDQPIVTTTDDALMAQRERAAASRTTQQVARELRNRPLTVPVPPPPQS